MILCFYTTAHMPVGENKMDALATGIGLVLMLTLGLSVANWVEVVFVSLVVGGMLLFSIPDTIWGYLHHVATGAPREEPS